MNATVSSNILLVDDEQDVLSSLKRTLRSENFNILTAQNAEEGLSIVNREDIHLVISDMQMPGINGAEFLQNVSRLSPKTVRMILTGYADLDATIHAINEGKIYSYITKPWKKDHLIKVIDLALHTQRLESEKKRLLELTQEQNKRLQEFNVELEIKVADRTSELKQSNDRLDSAYKDLKRNYQTAIEVFCRMMELRNSEVAGHCKRVAELAKSIAVMMHLPEQDIDNIYYAGLLHDIGKIHLSSLLTGAPFNSLTPDEKKAYYEHTTLGGSLLIPLDHFHPISHLIRHHHERYNGTGFPDQLRGNEIPLEAAILAVAEDFDEACSGLLFEEALSYYEARQMIADGSGKHYHPEVVAAFLAATDKQAGIKTDHGLNKVTTDHLEPGMVLDKDLIATNGILLLTEQTKLTTAHIEKIKHIEHDLNVKLILWITEGSTSELID